MWYCYDGRNECLCQYSKYGLWSNHCIVQVVSTPGHIGWNVVIDLVETRKREGG